MSLTCSQHFRGVPKAFAKVPLLEPVICDHWLCDANSVFAFQVAHTLTQRQVGVRQNLVEHVWPQKTGAQSAYLCSWQFLVRSSTLRARATDFENLFYVPCGAYTLNRSMFHVNNSANNMHRAKHEWQKSLARRLYKNDLLKCSQQE